MQKNILLGKTIFFFLSFTLLVGFYFNEDSSGSGGFISDFNTTWGYIEALKYEIFVLPSKWTVHTPLHYILLAKLNIIFDDQKILRFVFCLQSILLPLLFYNCLKIKYPKVQKNLLLIFASSIFLLPAFRSSAIWANNHLTALLFFLLFSLCYLKWRKKIKKNINDLKLVYLQSFFLALAVYTRQYYALFFFYCIYVYFENLKIKNLIQVLIFIFILTIPGFFLIYYDPELIKSTFDSNISNTLLVSSSIISFYLIPLLLFYFLENKPDTFINTKNLIILILSVFLVLFLNIFFDYNPKIGGGYFMKLSYLLFDNSILFILTSVIGFFSIFSLYIENKKNFILLFIFLAGFPAFMIFQKYFEPLLIFVFFLVLNTGLTQDFFNKRKYLFIYYIYLSVYLFSAILNDYFKITKTLI